MSKLKAIRRLLLASNYILVTDNTTDGSVSPIYAAKFTDMLEQEVQRQELATHKYEKMLDEIAENELNV